MDTLKDYTKIVVETDEKNPITIAEITLFGGIKTADGYRAVVKPVCDSEEPFIPTDSSGTKYPVGGIAIPRPSDIHEHNQ